MVAFKKIQEQEFPKSSVAYNYVIIMKRNVGKKFTKICIIINNNRCKF